MYSILPYGYKGLELLLKRKQEKHTPAWFSWNLRRFGFVVSLSAG